MFDERVVVWTVEDPFCYERVLKIISFRFNEDE